MIKNWTRDEKYRLKSLEWSDIKIKLPSEDKMYLYKNYTMPVANSVKSVFPAVIKISDLEKNREKILTSPKRTKPYTSNENKLFEILRN